MRIKIDNKVNANELQRNYSLLYLKITTNDKIRRCQIYLFYISRSTLYRIFDADVNGQNTGKKTWLILIK